MKMFNEQIVLHNGYAVLKSVRDAYLSGTMSSPNEENPWAVVADPSKYYAWEDGREHGRSFGMFN